MDYKSSPHLIKIFDFDILHLELNTPLFILLLVLVVMLFLNKLLFQPVLRTLENREAHLKTLAEGTESQRTQVARLTGEYQANLAQVRHEVAQARADHHRESQAQVEQLLAQARNESQDDFEQAMTDLHAQVDAAKAELQAATRGLADQISQRLIN